VLVGYKNIIMKSKKGNFWASSIDQVSREFSSPKKKKVSREFQANFSN